MSESFDFEAEATDFVERMDPGWSEAQIAYFVRTLRRAYAAGLERAAQCSERYHEHCHVRHGGKPCAETCAEWIRSIALDVLSKDGGGND